MSPNPSPDRLRRRAASRPRLIPALGVCAVVALLWVEFGARGPAEATAQLEQLANQITHVRVLHPDTARQLTEVMDRPQYDCAQIACNGELYNRNQAARARLRQSIASKMHRGEMVAGGHASN